MSTPEEWTRKIIEEAEKKQISPENLILLLVKGLDHDISLFFHMLKNGDLFLNDDNHDYTAEERKVLGLK